MSTGDATSWLAGSRGTVAFEDDQLRAVTLERDADVTYRHIPKDQVSRFRGDEMVLHFNTGVYNRFAWKAALCRVAPGVRSAGDIAINSVKGEEMDIYFANGLLVRVEVGPKAEGLICPKRMHRSGTASRQCVQALRRSGGG